MSGDLTQALRTAHSGLFTSQQALDTVSRNVANVNTPGYSRKIVNLEQRTVAGVGAGVVVGLVRAAGYRSQPLVGTLLTTLGVLVAANGPMTVLGITDPRTWSATDWASDIVPHLAYGAVVKTTMDAFDRL